MFYKNFQQPARLKRSLVQDLKPVSEGLGKRMMDEASDFGLKSGSTMPVHSPRGEMGVLSLTVNQSIKSSKYITQNALPYVQIFAGYLLQTNLPELKTPTLAMWVEQDRVFDQSGAGVLRELLPSTQIAMLPAMGHLPMMEFPAETAVRYRAFLQTQRAFMLP